MTDRLASPDTDFFENRRLDSSLDVDLARGDLLNYVQSQIAAKSYMTHDPDVQSVIAYLANSHSHDSEGRDLGFDKTSFSRTELRVCHMLPDAEKIPYLLYRYRFNAYPRECRVGRMPIILAVEPTSVCNIKCVMCFQMDERLTRRDMRGFMSMAVYQRIIGEAAAKGVGGIVLASRGEPLLHKEITEFVKAAKAAGIPDVKLNTNATRLSPRVARGLLEAGLDTLVFSVDSAVREQFEAIRIGANFDSIVANIDEFNRIRLTEFPESRTRTRISMVLIDKDQDSERAVDFWRSMVDEFAVRWAIPRLGIYEQAQRPDARPCSLLWERLYVWWDGTVNTCDEDYLSHLQVGRIAETGSPSIEELWRGDRMTFYREMHAAGSKNRLSPCSSCPGF